MMNKYLRYADILRQCKYKNNKFLCYRIKENTDATKGEALKLRTWIAKQLNGSGTYGRWLGIYYPKIWGNEYQKDFLTGREQWLDAMIKQLEEWGR